MAREREAQTAGDLLASRTPATAFSVDDEERISPYLTEAEANQAYGNVLDIDLPDEAEDEDEEGPPYPPAAEEKSRREQEAEARDQFQSLLEDAQEDEMGLQDYRRYWRRLQNHVLHNIGRQWRLDGPGLRAAANVGRTVRVGQQVGSTVTQLYAARHLGAEFTPFIPGPEILERPFVDKTMEYMRVAREDSLGAQLRRLETLANTDLQLAKTRTLFSAFDEDQRVNRRPIKTWRRVPGGENPCALCEIAADQVYFSDDLMAIHDNCMCDVEEADEKDLDYHKAKYHHIGFVERVLNTGQQVKAIRELADADAPPEDYHNLIKIEQHGELGPVLTWRGQDFTGPGSLPKPIPERPAPTVSGPGEAHEARMQRNRARVEQYRAQHFGPWGRPEPQYHPEHGVGSSHIAPPPYGLPPVAKTVKPEPKPKAATRGPRQLGEIGKVTVVIGRDGKMRIEKPGEKVTPKSAKAVDFDRDPLNDVLQYMSTKHRAHVDSDTWFDHSWVSTEFNDQAKRRTLQAIDEMLDRYPDVRVHHFVIRHLDTGVIASTGYDVRLTGEVEVMAFNSTLMRKTPAKIAETFKENVDHHHFFTGADQDPYRAMVWHEYGHVLDVRGGQRARVDMEAAVNQMWRDSPDGRSAIARFPLRATDPPEVLARNATGQHESYVKWLAVRDRVSGYSMYTQTIPGMMQRNGKIAGTEFANGEAIAQAFDDVERRGDRASDVSKMLHDRVVQYSKEAWPPPEGLHPSGRVGRAALAQKQEPHQSGSRTFHYKYTTPDGETHTIVQSRHDFKYVVVNDNTDEDLGWLRISSHVDQATADKAAAKYTRESHGKETYKVVALQPDREAAKVARGGVDRLREAEGRKAYEEDVYEKARAGGGITIDLEGHQPIHGLVYAPDKTTEIHIPLERFTVEDIDKFIDDHYEALQRKGNHLGLWEEQGEMYLDVSRVGKLSAATIEAAQKASQLGAFDLDTFKQLDIGTIDKVGRYHPSGKASDLLDKHRREVEAAAKAGGPRGAAEIPSGATGKQLPTAVDRLEAVTKKAYAAKGVERPEIPKERKKRGPVTRVGAGGPFTEPYDLKPALLPRQGVEFLDHEKMVANIIARYNDTTGDNAWIREAGMDWYPAALAWVKDMLERTGQSWTLEQAACMVAQFSENASWSDNMTRAENFAKGLPSGAFHATDARANGIVGSDDPASMMHGLKVINFGHAILGDDPNAVAIDRWAARIALGSDDKNFASKILKRGNGAGYNAMKEAYIDAANRLGLKPAELQAITWVHAVPPDATVRAFREAGEWQF